MSDTTVVRSEVDPPRLATGYWMRSQGPAEVPAREWVTVGSSNAYSTPADMSRYLAALMNGGTNEHGTVVKPETLATMYAANYQPDSRIPDMGLAFWRRDAGEHRVIEHQGLLPGFDSQIVVAPDDSVGLMAFTKGTANGGMWIPLELSRLLGRLLDVPEETLPDDVPQRPDTWADLCGWYHLHGPVSDSRIRGAMGLGVEVFVRRGDLFLGFLTPLPPLYRGLPLHPADEDDPYAFRMDLSEFGLGSMALAFSRDRETGTMAVHFETMPVSLYKRSRAVNPRLQAQGSLAAGVATLVVARRVRAAGRAG